MMITNNIKLIFIDSKKGVEKENINSDEKSRSSTLTMSDIEYELNFYKNNNTIRQSYIAKLISSKIWNPNMKQKQYNSIIIFEWDNILLPTSILNPCGIFDENIKLNEIYKEKLLKLEQTVLKLLTEAVDKGNVYIITNMGKTWVEYSSKIFYPNIIPILNEITNIPATEKYAKKFPGNQWKIETFFNLGNSFNKKLVTNIICIGDSLLEMETGKILASTFNEAFIKNIEFKQTHKLDDLFNQLKLLYINFGSIFSTIKDLTIIY